jgi:hypothetical protein
MQTQSELVEKYYNGLNEIYTVLKYTDKVSMGDLIQKSGLSKETVDVLKKGNVIKLTGRAKGSRWQWLTITPTKQMAFKTLNEIKSIKSNLNKKQYVRTKKIIPINITPKEIITDIINKVEPIKIDGRKSNGGIRNNSGRKSKAQELKETRRTIEFSLFWGLVKYKKQ